MSTFLRSLFKQTAVAGVCLAFVCAGAQAQQVPNSNFEDWNGTAFNGEPQPKGWNASNVEQVGLKFNFAHKETGRNGGFSMMVQDQEVGAVGITETSPGYFSLGQPWAYLPSITQINSATAGTAGGIAWTHRPDTMSVWIKRTGNNTDKEDFYLLYYSWNGKARGDKYKGKNGSCTSVTYYDEESDVRQAVNGNECGTTTKVTQVSEGYWREKKTYGQWTNIRVPILYMNNTVPTTMNIIFSASNYPNFRANSGLYVGNSLYVDDIELIYSSAIQKLYVDDKEWKGFDPASTEVQIYALGESATSIPKIEAVRGAGSITNAKGTTISFSGRTLSGNEISIVNGDLNSTPTTITVKSEDGKSETIYKIQFRKAASSNAKLAGISYIIDGVSTPVSGFAPAKYNYTVELPYGTTKVPFIEAEGQEDGQDINIIQPATINDKATIYVTAANGSTRLTYTLDFKVAPLADNTLQDILVNGKSIPGFSPSQTAYKVSLPVGTNKLPEIKAVSAYHDGEQTIEYTFPELANLDGGTAQIRVTTPGNQVAKVYKLNFKLEASSYSYLKDLKVGGVSVTDFVPTSFNYYINLPLGTTSLPAITYEKGDEYQTVEVSSLGAGVLDGTVRVTVTAGNGDQSVYKLIFSTEKSDRSTLNAIYLDGVLLPGFSPDVTTYTVVLPVGTTEMPAVTYEKGDEYQTVTVSDGGLNGKTRISVTAGDGSMTIYQISFSVEMATNATLDSILVGGELIEGFSPEVFEYYYTLPQGTTVLPEVRYVAHDEFQTITVRSNGVNGDYRITVRPQSGAGNTYVIHFSVEKADNTELRMIYLDGNPLENFHPDTLNYTITLPEGVRSVPVLTWDTADYSQNVAQTYEGKIRRLTVTAESGNKRTYTLVFVVQVSKDAFLNMIYLNGDSLEGFSRDIYEYTYQLNTGTCPVITVDKAGGLQVAITSPYSAGTARIEVKPEEGQTQIYTIEFTQSVIASVLLDGIFVNGQLMEGFDPEKFDYAAEYTLVKPEITWAAKDGQSVSLKWNGDEALLYVLDAADNTSVYTILFNRLRSADKSLTAILLDGKPMEDFKPDSLDYTRELEAGDTYPVVSFQTAETAQVTYFGQTERGKWAITVTAEDGSVQTYTVQFNVKAFDDVQLENLAVAGYSAPAASNAGNHAPAAAPFTFIPDVYDYNLTIDEDIPLPALTVTPKEGQTVVSYNASESVQKVVVTAESGNSSTYTITYTRTKSAVALLSDILIDGKSLEGFDENTFDYAVTLPQDTKVMPNIFPVGKVGNSTITTYYGNPNGVTKIHVAAQDGLTEADYTIAFTVTLSANTKLGELTINGDPCDVNRTDYAFTLPYGSTQPYDVHFAKAEASQTVDYTAAPVGGTSAITVKAENGDTRTYTIRYIVAQPTETNIIKKIKYAYTNADGDVVLDSITPVIGDNRINLPYGSQSFEVTEVRKNYTDQNIVFYNGGIRRGATVIAAANRDNAPDATYNIIPVMPAFNEAGKLKELKFKDELVPNWNPDVYNYLINVTEQPAAEDFAFTAFEEDKNVTVSDLNLVGKQVTFTVEGGETYSVCWYYAEDGNPFDFSNQWIKAKYNGSKPNNSWTVPGDCADKHEWGVAFIKFNYITGNEVMSNGNGVLLQTIHGASLAGSVPGMMTTGNMSLKLDQAGNSTSSVSESAAKGIPFRNTPDSIAFWRTEAASEAVTGWSFRLQMSDGSNLGPKAEIKGTYSQLNKPVYEHAAISYPSKPVVRFTSTMNAAHTENAEDLEKQFSGILYTSALQLRDIHFVYNSELSDVTVNGKPTVKEGNTFTYTLDENEVILGIPALRFAKRVPDQMQTVEWLNNGEWLDGELKAKVTNYGENSEDNTVYTVILKRTPVTSLNYTADFGISYPATEIGEDTTLFALPYGIRAVPDINITPESVHQRFVVDKNANEVTVTVTAEDGSSKTHRYIFRETKTASTELSSIAVSDNAGNPVDVLVEGSNRTFTTDRMPVIEFEKENIGQHVELVYNTADSATITVTAADGETRAEYTFKRIEPVVTTNGQITKFETGGVEDRFEVDGLGATAYAKSSAAPDTTVFFTLQYPSDSVVFVQTPDSMEWQVYGSENHLYKWKYETLLSANTDLAEVRIAGQTYSDYNAANPEQSYIIESDTAIWLETVAAEVGQTVIASQSKTTGGVTYTVDVTAENGNDSKQYLFNVRKPLSNISTLAGITLDGETVLGFTPENTSYEVTIPAPAIKTELQQIPDIAYIAGHEGQFVSVEPAGWEQPVTIAVTSEDGINTKVYELTLHAGKSHCSELSAIAVNGTLIPDFEAGRHYYSVGTHSDEIDVDWTCEDRFVQSVDTARIAVGEREYTHSLTVTAEDGSVTTYYIQLYVENKSNDAFLANITLDGKNFSEFEPEINDGLNFDSHNPNYLIYVPSGTTVMPEVSAFQKMDNQSVSIERVSLDTVLLHVTAADEKSKNTYTLRFVEKLSTNTNLSMITYMVNQKETAVPDFRPDWYFYTVELPVGVHDMPEVNYTPEEANYQMIDMDTDLDKNQVSLRVQAQDTTAMPATYVVLFRFSTSDADTLNMLYADETPLENFAPEIFYYTYSLPVGTTAFPSLSWEEADEWQTVRMDTVESTDSNLIRQVTVLSESGHKNIYTVGYTILKSDVDTLRMIYVDQKQLKGFSPRANEYYYQLTAQQAADLNGTLPEVGFDAGDDYQTVLVSQAPDSLAGKSLGYKTLITVTAATGKTNTYTIHYPVEMSSETALNMILLGGKPLANFDAERLNYKLEIEENSALPVVTWAKKEDVQQVELHVDEDVIRVVVTAENGTKGTYTIVFERLKSTVTLLRDIILTGKDGNILSTGLFAFRPENREYTVNLHFDPTAQDQLPAIEVIRYDSLQTVNEPYDIQTLPNGDIVVVIRVIAPNGEDEGEYSLTFHFIYNNDASLADLLVDGETIDGFNADITEYTISFVYGTDSASFFTVEDIRPVLSDSLATDSVWMDGEATIFIRVIAQDGETETVYTIRQTVALDADCALSAIRLDSVDLADFDTERMFYTYYLKQGANPPTVTAEARSENAEVSIREAAAGDTCMIICTAMNGTERRYYIHFAVSAIDDAVAPTVNDVIIKRIHGSLQYFVGTIRKDVTFMLYDYNGKILYSQRVPVADPNDTETHVDYYGNDVLDDVTDLRSGLIVDLNPNQIYFFSFVSAEGRILSGKIVAIP